MTDDPWPSIEDRIRAWPLPPIEPDQTIERPTVRSASGRSIEPRTSLLPTLEIEEIGPADLRLGAILGEGGMGKVYSAVQCSLGREVAVKMPHDKDGPEATVLMREATVLGDLEHPAVVPVYMLGVSQAGVPLMVMRKIEGTSWSKVVKDPEHPLMKRAGVDPMAFHLDVVQRVCDALELAHTREILHRDIKPDNVMLGRFGEVYLVDWGIAITMSEAQKGGVELTGTPSFMAPEMAVGDLAKLGPATDVYLVGATLYQVLTGRMRHSGPEMMHVLMAAARSAPPSFEGTDVPAELAAIIARATHADPRQRHATVSALRAEIAAFVVHRGSIALTRKAMAAESFAEAHFGFLAALQEWPGNALARDGLDDALARMARVDLERGNLEQAARWIAQRSRPDAALDAALEARRAEDARQRAETEAMRRRQNELDLSLHAAQRRSLFIAFAVIAGAISALALYNMARGRPLDHRAVLTYWLIVAVSMGGATLLLRKTVLATEMNRRIMGFTAGFVAAQGLNRVGGWARGATIDEIFITETLLSFLLAACAAVVITRRFFGMLPAIVALLGAYYVWPQQVPQIFGAGTAIISVSLAIILGRGRSSGATASG